MSKLSAHNSDLSIIRDFSFSKKAPVLRGVSLRNVNVHRHKSNLYSPRLVKCTSAINEVSSSNDDSGMQDESDEIVSNVVEIFSKDTELKGYFGEMEKISENISLRRTKSHNIDYSISFDRRRNIFEDKENEAVVRTASGSYF